MSFYLVQVGAFTSSFKNMIALRNQFNLNRGSQLKSPIKFVYSINNILLDSVSYIKDLSTILSFNLNFHQHIESTINLRKISGFVKRHSFEFKNPQSFLLLYNALDR